MATNNSGTHDCEARNQPKVDEWTCPECGLEWFGRIDGIAFIWETETDKTSREERDRESREHGDAPPPPGKDPNYIPLDMLENGNL